MASTQDTDMYSSTTKTTRQHDIERAQREENEEEEKKRQEQEDEEQHQLLLRKKALLQRKRRASAANSAEQTPRQQSEDGDAPPPSSSLASSKSPPSAAGAVTSEEKRKSATTKDDGNANNSNNNNRNDDDDGGGDDDNPLAATHQTQIDLSEGEEICDGKFQTVVKLGSGESSTVWLVRPTATSNNANNNNITVSNNTERLFAMKIFKCDERIIDSYEYERKVNEFMTKNIFARDVGRGGSVINNSSSSSSSSSSQQPQDGGDRSVSTIYRSPSRSFSCYTNQSSSTAIPVDPNALVQEMMLSPTPTGSPDSGSASGGAIGGDPAVSAALRSLPFAARDAWLRVYLKNIPKAQIKECRQPTFFVMSSQHKSPASFRKKRSRSEQRRMEEQQQHHHDDDATHQQHTTTLSPDSSSSRTANRPSDNTDINNNNNNNNNSNSSRAPNALHGGIAPLLGQSTHTVVAHHHHHRHHPCLIFDSFGPSVEWMMGVFSYRGVPLAVACQIIESTCFGLDKLASVHIVHTDLKPENLLFEQRDFVKLEAAAKKAMAAGCGGSGGGGGGNGDSNSSSDRNVQTKKESLFELFRVVTIDFGLSFVLPLSQRWPAPPTKRMKHHHQQHNSTTDRSSNNNSERDGDGLVSPSARSAATTTTATATSDSRGRRNPASATSSARTNCNNNNSSSAITSPRSPRQTASTPRSPRSPRSVALASSSSSSLSLSAEELLLIRMSNYRRGLRIQTREYRAPEIIFGAHFEHAADVWSLGCTAYELVTGDFLFDPKRDVQTEEIAEQGSELHERLMDLRHLWEMRRVCGEPSSKYLSKFGEGGSGVHAPRFVDTVTHNLRLTCECEPSSSEDDDDDDDDDGDERRRIRQDKKKKKDEELQQRRQLQEEGWVTFCPTCTRMVTTPQDGDRDLVEEAGMKFGMDREGARSFASFVRCCVQWEPSKRSKPCDLLRHPWLVVWARQFDE